MTPERIAELASVGLTPEDCELHPFNIQDYLKTEEEQRLYLQAALAENDNAFLQTALGDIAKARGMTELAKELGIGRSSLYKALSAKGNPQFATIRKVIEALGFELTITAKAH